MAFRAWNIVKLLFVSGTTTGGSGRSQRELALQLVQRGHDVVFVVDDKRPARIARWFYAQLSDASVRFESMPGQRVIELLRDAIGRHTTQTSMGGLLHLTTAQPHNALPGVIGEFKPDVIVANSVERWAWRRIHAVCHALGVPTILYVREVNSLNHVAVDRLPTVLLANADSLANTLHDRGFDCAVIPSVVNLDVTRTTSTRRAALAINPIAIKGGDFVWDLASAVPEVPFVLQEAWALSADERADIDRRLARTPNVTFRPRQEPGPGLYGDARVLLVPYRVDSRPRVVLEAQSNGIPVLAADVPALVEAVGPGGLILPAENVPAWAEALRGLWSDDDLYDRLCAGAREHARRSEVDPDRIAAAFEQAAHDAIQHQRQHRTEGTP